MVMLKVLTQYQEVSGDPRVIPVMQKYFRYELRELPNRPLRDWVNTGGRITFTPFSGSITARVIRIFSNSRKYCMRRDMTGKLNLQISNTPRSRPAKSSV